MYNDFCNIVGQLGFVCVYLYMYMKPCFDGFGIGLVMRSNTSGIVFVVYLVGWGVQTDENWVPNRLKILQNRRPGGSWTRLGSFFGPWRPLTRISLVKLGPKWGKAGAKSTAKGA